MREHARGEALHFRQAKVQAVNAAREAQERPDVVARQLRQRTLDARAELVAAATPQSVLGHAEELVAARHEEAEFARRRLAVGSNE